MPLTEVALSSLGCLTRQVTRLRWVLVEGSRLGKNIYIYIYMYMYIYIYIYIYVYIYTYTYMKNGGEDQHVPEVCPPDEVRLAVAHSRIN